MLVIQRESQRGRISAQYSSKEGIEERVTRIFSDMGLFLGARNKDVRGKYGGTGGKCKMDFAVRIWVDSGEEKRDNGGNRTEETTE